jgi:hypothetical protein
LCARHDHLVSARERRSALPSVRISPTLGQFFFLRESLMPRGITRGLASRLQRDIQKGIEPKRFVIKDPLMASAEA